MNSPGTVVDGKYSVVGLLGKQGGMGTLLNVACVSTGQRFALKYCNDAAAESLDRFRREVRLMDEYKGNVKVVQVLDSNLNHVPPYFVMPVYHDGDLTTFRPNIKTDRHMQEEIMLAMADCVDELHKAGKHHRDIKPENFLRSGSGVVICDFGLGKDTRSATGMTQLSRYAGTQGYIPPEFLKSGGFKNATPASDIFMLGKAFYNLITDLDPQYIDKSALEKPIFNVIDRCCQTDSIDRYQSIAELRQGIESAFDVILNRMAPLGDAQAKFDEIAALLSQSQYNQADVTKFIDLIGVLSADEAFSIIQSAEDSFFRLLSLDQFHRELKRFLGIYNASVSSNSDYSYAEVIASRMAIVFRRSVSPELRAKALEIALYHAWSRNRYAAMSTCADLIAEVAAGDPVATEVIALMQVTPGQNIINDIEPKDCKNPLIADQLRKRPKSN